MATPGILYVNMQPKPGLSLDHFNEWYNNEHGPTRLRFPNIFSNGLRYRATDGQQPQFLAAYDVTDMPHLQSETYQNLRANRSPRESDAFSQIDVTRQFYDLLHTKERSDFRPAEELSDQDAHGRVLVAVEITTTDAKDADARYHKWFIDEHAGLLARVPGWLRTRFFKTSSLDDDQQKPIYLALHEYAKDNGLGGDIHKASMNTPWRDEIFTECVASKGRRTYELFYVFGPAPRDVSSLSRLPSTAAFTSLDSKTSTTPGSNEVISSYITLSDSLEVPYRLEGNPEPNAPVVVLCNSLLTSLHMWDSFVDILKRDRSEFRILRYDTRGRHSIPQPPKPATLDNVTDDLKEILDALRVTKIHFLIGVSMGGVTTLNFALRFPDRVAHFIACDTSCTSSAANAQAWRDRTALAEENHGQGIQKLADQTVARWFHADTMGDKALVQAMTDIVKTNNVEGFKHSNTVLWDYDLKPSMRACRVPCLLVAGEGDGNGAVAKAMEGWKALLGENGTELRVVPNAGHLPMFEKPEDFWKAIRNFVW